MPYIYTTVNLKRSNFRFAVLQSSHQLEGYATTHLSLSGGRKLTSSNRSPRSVEIDGRGHTAGARPLENCFSSWAQARSVCLRKRFNNTEGTLAGLRINCPQNRLARLLLSRHHNMYTRTYPKNLTPCRRRFSELSVNPHSPPRDFLSPIRVLPSNVRQLFFHKTSPLAEMLIAEIKRFVLLPRP